ncbi:hypothetical protein M0R45_035113 [Rubus argutus]|uniref:Pentatricopeptide repeat-containing protein n=1 Tax=Rubus argutus TaxID=59490 RepID=A0AAW1VSZ9_RUBAR
MEKIKEARVGHELKDLFVSSPPALEDWALISSLLNVYCKLGLVLDARKVFDRMLKGNSVSWATMIYGYVMQQLAGNTLELRVLIFLPLACLV